MKKKPIRLEHPRHSHMVGDGFRVAQYIPGYGREMTRDTSPFLMLDYNAPWQISPQTGGHRPGVGYHPHRGFETVTIVYSGEVEHEDTAGNGGVIGADEVQWMTAGYGLLHNEFMTERFSNQGGIQHAVQLWVDLPREHKLTEPRYQALTRENMPEVRFDGGVARVIAGELRMKNEEGRIQNEKRDLSHTQDDQIIIQKGAAKTFSPVELYDVRFDSPSIRGSERGYSEYTPPDLPYEGRNNTITLTLPEGYNAMILVTEGSIVANEKELKNSEMLYLSREGMEITLTYRGEQNPQSALVGSSFAKGANILVMAGKPLEQPVVNYGPFVMTSEVEIEEAIRDFQAGKMGNIAN